MNGRTQAKRRRISIDVGSTPFGFQRSPQFSGLLEVFLNEPHRVLELRVTLIILPFASLN